MTFKMYAIRDVKTAFMQPSLDVNHDSARRNFQLTMATANGNSIMGFCPEDFDLYYIGEFDNDSGIVSPLTVPELIHQGRNLEV